MAFGVRGGRAAGRRAPGQARALVAGLALLVALLSACGGSTRPRVVAVKAVKAVPLTTTTEAPTTTAAPPLMPASTLVATTHGAIPGSTSPGGPPTGTVPASWYGYPTILPVIDQQPGWLEVRLAQRPNGAVAWVPAADVSLSSTPYRIVIELGAMDLKVYEGGRQILAFPAGVGTSDDPTVTGHYFVTMQAPAPSPGYGPFVLVTSAHSATITDWEGLGDAIIAIHGPIDSYDDGLIGATGARISHGCVRLHDSDLAQLAMIPAGTPIDIIP
ncbi:MAG TPA: L,D-transpeptidase [Acidimicrobiales bacterium]